MARVRYIIFLAVIMNTRRLLNYPKSAIHLANGFYVDLFLNPKSIISYQHDRNPTDQNTNSMESPDLKRLFIKEDSEDMMLGECNPEEDKDFQNLLCNGVAWSLFSDEVMRQYFKFPCL